MDILSYLTDLLNKQNEVGIEGLGTFFKQKLPGRYDTENHLFIPPTYLLRFKAEINEGATLGSYLSSTKDISSDSAQHYVSLFVEDINRQLAVSNEADLDSIGKLSYVDDVLILKEQGNIDLGSEFYGLPKISTKIPDETIIGADVATVDEVESKFDDDLEVYDEITEPTKVNLPEPKVEIETPETLESSTIDLEKNPAPPITPEKIQELKAEEETSKAATANIWHFDKERSNAFDNNLNNQPLEDVKTGTSGWIMGLIAIIVLAVVGAGAYFLKPEWFGNDRTPLVKIETKDTIATPKVQPVTIDTLNNSDTTVLSNTVDKLSKPLSAVDITKDSTTWEIIGASLTKGEVSQYTKDMKARGYTVKPVPAMPGKKRIKMSIATFNSEESAIEGRKLLVQKLKNKDLYIFQNKNTQKPL